MALKAEMRVQLILDDKFSKELKRAAKRTSILTRDLGGFFKSLRRNLFSLKTLIATYILGKLSKSFVDAAAEAERFRTQLWAIYQQNLAMANQTLKWVREFGKVTPFTTQEVVRSFNMLKAVGIDVTKDMMKVIGDAAFAMNKSIVDVGSALISGRAIMFRNYGIELDRSGKKAVMISGHVRKVVTNDLFAIRKAAVEIWSERLAGSMKRAEKDWRGMVAILKSRWWEFQVAVMESGVFDYLKAMLRVVGEAFKAFEKNPKSTAMWVMKAIKGITIFVAHLIDISKRVVEALGIITGALIVTYEIAMRLGRVASPFAAWVMNFHEMEAYIKDARGAADSFREAILAIDDTLGDMSAKTLKFFNDVDAAFEKMAGEKFLQKQFDELAPLFIHVTEQLKAMKDTSQEAFAVAEYMKVNDELQRIAAVAQMLGEDFKLMWHIAMEAAEKLPATTAEEATALELVNRGLATHVELQDIMIDKYKGMLKHIQKPAKELEEMGTKSAQKVIDAIEWMAEKMEKVGGIQEYNNELLEKNLRIILDIKAVAALEKQRKEFKKIEKILLSIGNIMVDHILQAFEDIIDRGAKPLKEYMAAILKDIGMMLAKTALTAGVKALASSGAGMLAGARGGVFLGSKSIKGYARGGITDGPELALYGEGRNREAVIPLPDNRHVPIKWQGEDPTRTKEPTQVNITIHAIDAQGVDDFLVKNRAKISRAVGISHGEGR